MRKVSRFILWGLLILLVLVGGAWAALQTDEARGYVLSMLSEQLDDKLAGRVEIDSVSGPLLWGATLHDVAVFDARGQVVIRADEVETSYSLLGLLDGELEFGQTHLEAPVVNVLRYPDGALNLSLIARPSEEPKVEERPEETRIAIYGFDVESGLFSYEDLSDAGDAEGWRATDVDATGNFRLRRDGQLWAYLDDAKVRTDAGVLPEPVMVAAEGVVVEKESDRLRVAVEEAELGPDSRVEGLKFTLLSADDELQPALVANVEQLAITPSLASTLAPDIGLAATLQLSGEVAGTADELTADLVAQVAGAGQMNLRGAFDPAKQSATLVVDARDIDVPAWTTKVDAELKFDARGTVTLELAEQGGLQVDTRLALSDLQADELRADRLILGGEESFELRVGDRIVASGPVRASGVSGPDFAVGATSLRLDASAATLTPGSPINYDVQGRLSRVRFDEHAADQLDIDVDGVAVRANDEPLERLTSEGSLDVRGYRGKGMRARRVDVNGSGVYRPDRITGSVRTDLDRLVVDDRVYGSTRFNLKMREGDAFALDMRAVPAAAPGLPISLRTAGTHAPDFEQFNLSQFAIGRPGLVWGLRDSAVVRVDDEAVTLDSFVVAGLGGVVRLDGTYPLEGTLAAIIERIGLDRLNLALPGGQELDELEKRLQKEVPGQLKKVVPEELDESLEKLPDDAKDDVVDEIRKRLPGF